MKDMKKVFEIEFNKKFLSKYESIFSQGNGYMGIRAVTEESYVGEKRNTFVAGTFNRFIDEVTELPNIPDVVGMEISLNGAVLDLSTGKITDYTRYLDVKTGELVRIFTWISSYNETFKLDFRRIVSKNRRHVIAQKISIIPLTSNMKLNIKSGINGQVSNSGSQHFTEGEMRLFHNKIVQMTPKTIESEIEFVLSSIHSLKINEQELNDSSSHVVIKRRKIYLNYQIDVGIDQEIIIEKISTIYTSRDNDIKYEELKELSKLAQDECLLLNKIGYNQIRNESEQAWVDKIWNEMPLLIDSVNPIDQLAINFAIYHLHVMTPEHDNRMNIGAKGLSGEGYKGHTFWDTEIFILPYFIYTHPGSAKKLVEYRYNCIEGARQKANNNKYEGAQYPWESAWIEDGETAPYFGNADVITGERQKIWTGLIEHHITSDVVIGIMNYFNATNDTQFMKSKGYQVILEAAKFWCSRLEYNNEENHYEILNVIGPDEYKEHVDNNAYTNYTAHYTLKTAKKIIDNLEDQDIVYKNINQVIDIYSLKKSIEDKLSKFYLPVSVNNVIPQDDKYLSLKDIDLTKYKSQSHVNGLFLDYNMEQVGEMQVSKQADVMLLIYLFENTFTNQEKISSWNYYEPRTLHDSSLSLAVHSILAADMNDKKLAYSLFSKASMIDLGPVMFSSDEGLHAGSLGALWQTVVFGFGGFRIIDGKMRLEPNIPSQWNKLVYHIYWSNQKLKVSIDQSNLEVINLTKKKNVEFLFRGKEFKFKDKINIQL